MTLTGLALGLCLAPGTTSGQVGMGLQSARRLTAGWYMEGDDLVDGASFPHAQLEGESEVSVRFLYAENPLRRFPTADCGDGGELLEQRAQSTDVVFRVLVSQQDEHVVPPRFTSECTGTVVEHAGATFVLTAAHCMFRISNADYVEAAARSLGLSRGPTQRILILPQRTVRASLISASFVDCLLGGSTGRRSTVLECASDGLLDLAMIPVRARNLQPWRVDESTGSALPDTMRAFGFGLSGREYRQTLQSARFTRSVDQERQTLGSCGNVADPGNSGGSVISTSDDWDLHANPPRVAAAISARFFDGSLQQWRTIMARVNATTIDSLTPITEVVPDAPGMVWN